MKSAAAPARSLLSRAVRTGLQRREAAVPEQARHIRVAAAEQPVGFAEVARTAARVNVGVESFGRRRVERIAGLVEGSETVGVEHLRPQVAVVAGRIAVA